MAVMAGGPPWVTLSRQAYTYILIRSFERHASVRLTLHTDYSLRVLLYAALKPGQLCTIPELVRHFDISRGHLMKVVHGLARIGYLQTTRGKNGGLRLARPPADISVGAVVRDM